jgi:hypothetical protein
LEMEPNFALCTLWLGVACTEKGMHEEAVTSLLRAYPRFDNLLRLIGVGTKQ